MFPSSFFMIHNATTGCQNEVTGNLKKNVFIHHTHFNEHTKTPGTMKLIKDINEMIGFSADNLNFDHEIAP